MGGRSGLTSTTSFWTSSFSPYTEVTDSLSAGCSKAVAILECPKVREISALGLNGHAKQSTPRPTSLIAPLASIHASESVVAAAGQFDFILPIALILAASLAREVSCKSENRAFLHLNDILKCRRSLVFCQVIEATKLNSQINLDTEKWN